jgi:MerR family transcriptional regulator, mercuric resistance operon regulatory protein
MLIGANSPAARPSRVPVSTPRGSRLRGSRTPEPVHDRAAALRSRVRGEGIPPWGVQLDLVPGYGVHAGGVRTSEVAAQAQVKTQTLRYYERRGLLPEPARTRSGYRAYTPDAVRVVRFVKRAQQLGFTLDDIEELLHLAQGGPASCDEARAMARTRIADLQRRIEELAGMRDALARLVDTCDQPRAERDCPILQDIETAAATTTSAQE